MTIRPLTIVSIILVASIISYAYYASSALRLGPVIRIDTPLEYSSVPGAVRVTGNIKHVGTATINEKPMTFTLKGDFDELLVLTPPLDTIDIVASGTYGKVTRKSIQVSVSK